jgi:hypothetical protein
VIGEPSPAAPIAFVVAAVSVAGTLFVHAVRTRGVRVAVGFFLVAAVFSFGRDAYFVWAKSGGSYTIQRGPSVLGVSLLAPLGWCLTLYLAWCLGEALASGFEFSASRLFPTLAFAYAVIAAVSWAVEPSAVAAGLWSWRSFDDSSVDGVRDLAAVYGPIALYWARFGAKLLLVHWLIEGSSLRGRRVRFLALAIPVAPLALASISGLPMGALFPLVVLALAALVRAPLGFPPPARAGRSLDAIPFVAALSIAGILVGMDLLGSGRVDRAVTKLPLGGLTLLALAARARGRRRDERPAIAPARLADASRSA